ncbi:inorganic diphosphatase [Candidatus Gracilibacteria bacterium]|nr:inorganic diphosphatase [Candidatus Gracilibacteria bacterium]
MAINQWFEQLRTQFYARNYLGRAVTVVVDRPLGSFHPKHGFQYPVNYGYLPNTLAPDGEGIDAYILGVDQPMATFQGRCIAIVHRLNDNDDKLIVVPEGTLMTDAAIGSAVHFQEQWFTSRIIRDRNQIYGHEKIDRADDYGIGMVWHHCYFGCLCAQQSGSLTGLASCLSIPQSRWCHWFDFGRSDEAGFASRGPQCYLGSYCHYLISFFYLNSSISFKLYLYDGSGDS